MATPAGKGGRRTETGKGSATNGNAVADGPRLGERIEYRCPFCGCDTNATYTDKYGWPEWLIKCWSADCESDHLPSLAELLGLDAGADKNRIAAALRERGRASAVREGKPEELPDEASVAGWRVALEANRAALDYLTVERGLTLATIRRARIGYAARGVSAKVPWANVPAFTLPVFDGGELVAVRRRFWPEAPTSRRGKVVKIVGPRHRPAALYPAVPAGRALIVAEGELDALLLRQKGLPAVTSTASTSWREEWNGHVHGRRVAVIYDTGPASLRLARRRATEFRAAGAAEAWAVDLGLPNKGDDVTDWFVTYGRSADDLRTLIRAERRSA